MAKIEVRKALSLNSQDPKALEVKKLLEQSFPVRNNRKKTEKVTKTAENKEKKTDKGGGLFGVFFGGNKK